jgi:hypothetical protein
MIHSAIFTSGSIHLCLPNSAAARICKIFLLGWMDGWVGSLFQIASFLHIEMNKKHWKNQGRPTEL